MVRVNDHLQVRPISLIEERNGRNLLVWGDLGQWLVVDAEVALLVQGFAQKRRVGDVLRQFSREAKKPYDAACREALPVLEALVARGILGSSLPKAAPPDDPLTLSSLTFNLTNRCNLHCPWCYNPPSGDKEIPIPQLLKWVAAGAKSMANDASFFILGGEPFLDQPRLREAVAGARAHFQGEILVSTNGTLLSDETAPALAKANVTVQISLDSPSAGKHDSLRGSGVFARATGNARRLIAAGVSTIFSMVMLRQSEEEFEAYFDLAATIGAQEVRFIPLRRIGRGTSQADQVPDLYACFQRLVEILKRRPELARLLQRDFFSVLMTVCRFSRLRSNCGIGRRCLFVDADGSIFPCPNHRQPEFHCGRVGMTPLATVLETTPLLHSLRLQYQLEGMPKCRQCLCRYWCAGDCRAEAVAVTGDPLGPSPYCEAIQKVMKDMFWLIAEGWQSMGVRDQLVQPWS